MEIGERIRELRKKRGLTQEKLAKMIGISTPAVSKWETGNTLPDILMLAPLSRALGCSVDELLSYQIELSEEEADKLLKKVKKTCEEEGFNEGMKLAFSLINEYPNADYLKLKVANSSLSFIYTVDCDYTEDQYEQLLEKSTQIFEELTLSKNAQIAEVAKAALASRYITTGKIEKAEDILLNIPKNNFNPDRMWPTLYLMKQDYEQSIQCSQKTLLQDLQGMLMDIMSMYTVAMRQEQYDRALSYAMNYRALSSLYGNYFTPGTDMIVKVYLKLGKRKQALKWFETMIEDILTNHLDFSKSIYFDHIANNVFVASDHIEDNMKEAHYKSIILDQAYDCLKEDIIYQTSMEKLQSSLL